jgi:hypothetical protein
MNNDFVNIGPAPEDIRRQVAAEISARIDLQFATYAFAQNAVATAVRTKPITIEDIIAATTELAKLKDQVTDFALWCYTRQRAANIEGLIYENDQLPIFEPTTTKTPTCIYRMFGFEI